MPLNPAYSATLIVLLALGSLACGQEQSKTPDVSALPPGVRWLRDLEYVPGGHERQKLDLYLPEKANDPLPVIVWVHGGGWKDGNKDWRRAVPLVPKGYAVANINYRLSQDVVFPAQIEDSKAAIRWLRANARKYHLDPNHIGAWGPSAGGHLVALLGTTSGVKELEGTGGNLDQSSRIQCVVDWFGPTDLATMGGRYDEPDSSVARLIGGPVQKNKEKAAKASPVIYVAKDAAPFLIMHGDRDDVVPLEQSVKLAEALRRAGADVTLQVYTGAGHGGRAFSSPESWKMIEDFFARHLHTEKPCQRWPVTDSASSSSRRQRVLYPSRRNRDSLVTLFGNARMGETGGS
jgi:acetyl esterase/lipase